MGAADITPATTGIGMGGGFRRFIFPAYYPVFAVSAVVFWPSRLSLGQPGLYDGSVAQGAGSPAHGRPGAGCPAGRGGHSSKNTRPGDRAQATVQRTGGDYPLGVTLWPSVVNGWQAGPVLPPGYVRRSEDRLCEPRSPRLDHRRCWMTQLMPSWQRPGHPGSGIAGLWWTSPWSWSWCCGAVVFARSEAAVPVRPDPAPSAVQHNHEVELQLIGEVGVEQQPPQR